MPLVLATSAPLSSWLRTALGERLGDDRMCRINYSSHDGVACSMQIRPLDARADRKQTGLTIKETDGPTRACDYNPRDSAAVYDTGTNYYTMRAAPCCWRICCHGRVYY